MQQMTEKFDGTNENKNTTEAAWKLRVCMPNDLTDISMAAKHGESHPNPGHECI